MIYIHQGNESSLEDYTAFHSLSVLEIFLKYMILPCFTKPLTSLIMTVKYYQWILKFILALLEVTYINVSSIYIWDLF